MNCRIEWKDFTLPEWQERFEKVRRSTLLQSYAHARATCPRLGQKPRWGAIYLDDQEAGIVQIAEASTLHGLLHAVILDMGPLWYDPTDLDRKNDAFTKAFNLCFPKRIGRKRRFIPNIAFTQKSSDFIEQNGFIWQKESRYTTIWLDLTKDAEDLRKSLHPKWRNQLSKSERYDLTVIHDTAGDTAADFIKLYQQDIKEKAYKNIPPARLYDYIPAFAEQQSLLLAHAVHHGNVVASALVLRHGTSATYQIGYLSPEGRPLCANHFLLWRTLLTLKETGIKDFDLGGVNAYDARDIQHFKERMGGETVIYSGLYS